MHVQNTSRLDTRIFGGSTDIDCITPCADPGEALDRYRYEQWHYEQEQEQLRHDEQELGSLWDE